MTAKPASERDVTTVSRAELARLRWLAQNTPPKNSSGRRLNIWVAILYALVIVSLALNARMIWELKQARDRAYAALDQLIATTEQIEQEKISIPIHVEREFPVKVAVPFEYSTRIPVSANVPISTTIVIPFTVMGKSIEFPVPIQTTIPVNVEVPVSLSKTFHISTNVPVVLDVNVEVKMSDTPIPKYMGELRAMLLKVRGEERDDNVSRGQ